MAKWIPLKNAEGKSGIRYREHAIRKHGAVPDRYYVVTYWWQGKTHTEAVGWASEKWTPSKCFDLLAQIKENQATGQGPCTLAELREQSEIKKTAERKRRQAERQHTFKAFFDEVFLPDAQNRWKPQTTAKAEQHIKNWIDPVTADTPMRELGLIHANKIKNNLAAAGRTPRMQQYVFRTFAMVWNAALDHGLASGPCPTKSASFRLPKVDNEKQRYLTVDEEKKLLAEVLQLSRQAHDMAVVSLDAGLRFGEVATLTWGCIDQDSGILRVLDTKSGHDRMVPMTARLKSIFECMTAGGAGDLVFPNPKGKVWFEAPSAFRTGMEKSKLNEGIENPKLKASFHTLRHTCASRLVQAGVDLYRVQRLLGHSTPTMTARYSKLADDDLRQAVVAMEQDGKVKASRGKVIRMKKKEQVAQ
jgi:integrase